MEFTLPEKKDLYPSLLYCSDLLLLEKSGAVARYEESSADSSEEQIMTAKFVLRKIYNILPQVPTFRYWQPSTSYEFSRSLFNILLNFRCAQATNVWIQALDLTNTFSDTDELRDNLLWVSKKLDLDQVSIISDFDNRVDNLEKQFTFTTPVQIRIFLFNNRFLLDILAEAPKYIWKVFGQVPIYLEMDTDPEEGWEELFIIIRSPFPAQKAMELEKQVRKEWFLSRIESTRGKLNIIEQPL